MAKPIESGRVLKDEDARSFTSIWTTPTLYAGRKEYDSACRKASQRNALVEWNKGKLRESQ